MAISAYASAFHEHYKKIIILVTDSLSLARASIELASLVQSLFQVFASIYIIFYSCTKKTTIRVTIYGEMSHAWNLTLTQCFKIGAQVWHEAKERLVQHTAIPVP